VVEPKGARVTAVREIRLDDDVAVLPGLVDSHVHVCEPGNTEWEGFASATRAAAAGGITTVVDMPIDSVPATVSVAALREKREAAAGKCRVDVGFWGGAVPGNLDQMGPLRDNGVLGFKCFLIDPGVPGFGPLDPLEMERALRTAAGLGVPLLVHAESAELVMESSPGRSYPKYLASRPRESENVAIAQVIEAARRTGGRAHIVHLSSSDALPMIAAARGEGVQLTVESCPHYLALAAEEIEDGATACKCSPPIRESENRERLWAGLKQDLLDMVVSDHSPCTPAMRQVESGDFGSAWGGISSLQLSLPVTWTQARSRGFTLADLAGWMSQAPARLAGLRRKGRIAPGFEADLCIFAPEETFLVEPGRLYHRHPITPYTGRRLTGVVRQTFLRGEPVDFERGTGEPRGRRLGHRAARAAEAMA
jgi:allantoinase